jgi:hypothetical protein
MANEKLRFELSLGCGGKKRNSAKKSVKAGVMGFDAID